MHCTFRPVRQVQERDDLLLTVELIDVQRVGTLPRAAAAAAECLRRNPAPKEAKRPVHTSCYPPLSAPQCPKQIWGLILSGRAHHTDEGGGAEGRGRDEAIGE